MLDTGDTRDAGPASDEPVTIVIGAKEHATPVAMAEAMHTTIPGATHAIIYKVRHNTTVEVPDIVASTMIKVTLKHMRAQGPQERLCITSL